MTEQNDVIGDDSLVALWSDVRSQRNRISKIADPTPKKVLIELSETGLSVMEDLIGMFVQFRQYVSESLGDIDGRLNSLEESGSAPPLLDEESAEMILRLAGTCEAFVRLVRDSSTSISGDAQEKLEEALSLVEEVRLWVSENIDEDELQEPSGDEEDDVLEENSYGGSDDDGVIGGSVAQDESASSSPSVEE